MACRNKTQDKGSRPFASGGLCIGGLMKRQELEFINDEE